MTDKTSHVWGTFGEVVIHDTLMSRVIRFYRGGWTSLHRHDVSEVLVVERGSLRCHAGRETDQLDYYELEPGDVIVLPARTWHSVGCKEPIGPDAPYALAFEIIFGGIVGGEYAIERARSAQPSADKERVVASRKRVNRAAP